MPESWSIKENLELAWSNVPKESHKNADKKNLDSVGVAADVGEDIEAEDGTSEIEEDDISEIEDDGTSEIEDGSEMEAKS